ncbi:hypothetical protein GDO86_012576 [Hymenochirus boettgeri]|uniref:RING-type E3 ubiquitin transferase n=1 Tax=Hymenochirus boettgeri TaxID=247094 RepID=A0A8T2IR56_9PIPI|nr:hypothetical protein GDO86_012576 [Hymenochirus boettgeri]
MAFSSANKPQLIRSSQKDDLFLGSLRNQAHEVYQAFAGAKKWLQWRKEIELFCDLAYYCMTTFSGYQTLGEEYVNIVQVDSSKRKVPSWYQCAVLICCHTLLPYLLDKELVRLEHELQIDTDGVRLSHSGLSSGLHRRSWMRKWIHRKISALSEQQKKTMIKTVYVVRQSIAFLRRLHLAIFYMNGVFYHISKRITGINYGPSHCFISFCFSGFSLATSSRDKRLSKNGNSTAVCPTREHHHMRNLINAIQNVPCA